MEPREYQQKAEEADLLSAKAASPVERLTWANIASEYRRLAYVAAEMRKPSPDGQNEPS